MSGTGTVTNVASPTRGNRAGGVASVRAGRGLTRNICGETKPREDAR